MTEERDRFDLDDLDDEGTGDFAADEELAAAEEAAAIGGVVGDEHLPPDQRPLVESGGGEAEGFEESERQLIEAASHGDPAGHPLADRFPAEDARAQHHTIYGEADHEKASEKINEDN
jgi:hypothetical protein